ncbi:Cyclic AMP receptor 1 [Madurella fahalii]|uniref:Cyclic AMP receptor 1 n=1 Tax=Madurella fahalii TaxID=1157608 RepID=A0ABQ0GK26_9PEZI
MRGLSAEDAASVIAIERACSAISLMGCIFVLVTFAVSDAFRQRAINRMVFYATFGNMLTNVATLMTTSYTHSVDSFGCQLQAFLIQVFMQGDAYWALSMAINVYLTFYHKYDARMLRRMEIPYFLCCYGLPFIPGFTFLFVSTESAGRPYGNAVLWCWLKGEWEVYRIATFYGPIWVAIVIAMTIYIRAGRQIYLKRRRMLNFSSTGTGTIVGSEPFSPLAEFSPAFNFKTTEVTQTTEIIQPPAPVAAAGTIASSGAPQRDPNVSYSVTISATPVPDNENSYPRADSLDDLDSAAEATLTSVTSNPPGGKRSTRVASITHMSAGPIITSGNHNNGNLNTNTTNINSSGSGNANTAQMRRRNYEINNATWSYTKCAILFFAVLLITWLPSSGNRVYSMINDGDVSKPLFFASAFVLPLQGFWNAIIYIVTSWAACKSLWAHCLVVVAGGGGWRGCWAATGGRLRRRVSLVEIADARKNKKKNHPIHRAAAAHAMARPKQAGVMAGMWAVGRREGKEESTSMEDLTREGRADRVSPV